MRLDKWKTIIILFVFCGMLNSCGGKQPQMDTSPVSNTQNLAQDDLSSNDLVLSFRITWKSYSGRGEAIQAIVDQYNRQADDTITLTDGDEDRAAVETLLTSEPETIFVLPYRFIQYFGGKGYLQDLTGTFADEKALFYDTVWALASVDGKTFGVPWLGHSMCLLYNKNLLESAGLRAEAITSMESFLDMLDTIDKKTGVKGLALVGAESNDLSWMVNQFIYGFGSSLVSEDGKTVAIHNEKSVRALETYRDLLGPYAQQTWLNDTAEGALSAFRNQETAFVILGIWGVTDILKNGSPFEVGILPLRNIGLCSEVGPMMMAVPAGMSAQGKEAAYDFIRYMISREAQEEIMKGEYSPEHDVYYPFRTPIRYDMADSQIFIDHPEYLTFIEGFQTPSIDVPVPGWQTVKDEIYTPGLHRVMSGEITIEAFLSDVETRGNQILQEQ